MQIAKKRFQLKYLTEKIEATNFDSECIFLDGLILRWKA